MDFAQTIYNSKDKLWHGRHLPLLYHSDVSVAQIIINSLEQNPNRVVQISADSGIEVTTDEIKVRTIRAAIHLLKLSLTNDDCIGIVSLNNHHLAPIVLAALLIGVPIHPLDPSIDSGDMSHHFNLSKPKIIFCDNDMLDRVKMVSKNIELNPILVTFDKKLHSTPFVEEYFQPTSDENDFVPVQIENGVQKVALIMCSSGTTGLSKAICLSHAQVTDKLNSIFRQTYNDIYLCFSSIYAVAGILSILCGLRNGCIRIITKQQFTPELFFHIVEKYRVTQFLGPPSQFGLLFQHNEVESADLSSMRRLYSGGSSVSENYSIKAKKYFPNSSFVICYGATEVCGLLTANLTGDRGHAGNLLCNTEIKILNECGNNLGVNEVGEIVARHIFGFLGYKGDPELTKDVLNTDGWIYTGDIGNFDNDGNLYIVDRKKSTFKYRGLFISPTEIEQFLIQQDFIENVCVVGIPDDLSGELPAAIFVKSKRFKPVNADASIEEIIYNLVKDNLADYKLLRGGVYMVNKLPLTPSGKIIRGDALQTAVKLYKQKKKL